MSDVCRFVQETEKDNPTSELTQLERERERWQDGGRK